MFILTEFFFTSHPRNIPTTRLFTSLNSALSRRIIIVDMMLDKLFV